MAEPMSVDRPIDIIIPVYRGIADVRRCLESVLAARNQHPLEIVVINDASPEPAVASFLRELGGLAGVTLLENAENLGFVRTVNRGMALHPDRDVILLNSDTEVAHDWVDRLAAGAAQDPRIATVTPFSNNATIASYPRFCENNALPEGYDTARLDGLFRETNAGALAIDLPTAVGFCMLIRRTSLRELGPFDAESFGRGYGEENDFSLRARKKGWRNVLCPNVFVRHVGGVSFGESQKEQMKHAEAVLARLHPDYGVLVQAHVADDPARALRAAVDLRRLAASPRPVLLFTNHNLGGGTQKHIDDLARLFEGRAEILLLRPAPRSIRTELSWNSAREGLKLFFTLPGEYLALLEILTALGVARVHFHHLLGLDPGVRQLPRDLGVPYDLTIHDFYLACPRTHLTTVEHAYCGEPEEAGCNRCLARRPPGYSDDISAWRRPNRELAENAERVIAPSRFVEARVRRYFPQARILLAPHPELDPPSARTWPPPNPSEPLRILVLGALDEKKGATLVLDCAERAKRDGLPLEFHLHGHFVRERDQKRAKPSGLIDHGPYPSDAELVPSLNRPPALHLAWFPTRCPETYCYALSVPLALGLPILASDLGAFPERLTGQAQAWLFPWRSGPLDWLTELRRIRDVLVTSAAHDPCAKPHELTDAFYQDQYLRGVTKREGKLSLPAVENSTRLGSLPRFGGLAFPDGENPPKAGRKGLRELLIFLRYAPALAPIARSVPAPLRRWVRSLLAKQ